MTMSRLSKDISLYILNFYTSRLAKMLKMFGMAIFRGPIKNAKCVQSYVYILGYFVESSVVIKRANMIMNNVMFIQ